MIMKEASTVELKTHLGQYLRQVAGGDTIVVTSHRRPVARLVQPESSAETVQVIPPERPISDVRAIKPRLSKKVDALNTLLLDRARR